MALACHKDTRSRCSPTITFDCVKSTSIVGLYVGLKESMANLLGGGGGDEGRKK